MQMLTQILLNVSVLVFGIVLLFPFSSRMNTPLYIALAWFCGWATVVITEMLLVMTGVYVTMSMIAGCATLCVILLWIVARNSIAERIASKRKQPRQLNWQLIVLLLSCVAVFVLLACFGQYSFYSPDSVQIESLSRTFHKYGVYGDGKLYSSDNSEALHPLFGNRLPFYVAIHNVAYLCGIEVFYSFMGATTFFMCLTLWGFWREENDESRFFHLIWFLLVLALFLSNRMVILHSFYTHTNLTTMAYYTLGILSLYGYLKKKDNLWFMLACFFLGCTGILRIEMLLFSLLPFCYVVWKGCFPRPKITLLGFALYFLGSYLWFSWGVSLLGIAEAVGDKGDTFGLLNVALGFLLSLITFFFPWQITSKRVRVGIYVLLSICASLFVYCLRAKLMISWNGLYLLAAKGVGFWGSFWWLLFSGVCIYVLLGIRPILHDILSRGTEASAKTDKGVEFLVFVTVAFLITRVALYSIGGDRLLFQAVGSGDSGNRILLHIYPVSVYFLGRIGAICTGQITERRLSFRS